MTKKLQGTANDGTVQVVVGDEFDPKLTRSHKYDVSGRETEPELTEDDAYRPDPPRPNFDDDA